METLFTQGNTAYNFKNIKRDVITQGNIRKLNDDDFMLYEDLLGCSSLRCEEDLISVHQNQIDDVVDFETFNKLKEFSSKIQSLKEEINSKLIELKITSLQEAVLPPSPLATTARAVPQLPSATSPPRHH